MPRSRKQERLRRNKNQIHVPSPLRSSVDKVEWGLVPYAWSFPPKKSTWIIFGSELEKKYDFWITRNEELTIQVTLILAQFSFSCLSELSICCIRRRNGPRTGGDAVFVNHKSNFRPCMSTQWMLLCLPNPKKDPTPVPKTFFAPQWDKRECVLMS